LRFSRLLTAAVLAGSLTLVTGCASEPPPVSDKVQKYYDENVNKPMTAAPSATTAALKGEGMLGAIQQAIAGPDPVTISVLGDSTGNGPGEWVDLWSKHLVKYGTVTLHMWNQAANDWEPEPRVFLGGPKTITVWNGSQPGSTYTYPLERLETMQPEKPSFTIMSFGHNMAAKSADAGAAELLAAVDMKWGAAVPAAITLQNPAQGEREPHTKSSVDALTAWAPRAGYPTINVNKAFLDAGPIAALLQDVVHPNPAGSQIWVDTVIATLG
jgi:hypothetical protein